MGLGAGPGPVATPAERSWHELSRRDVELESGERAALLLLVSRLEFSGHLWASVLPDDELETVLRGLAAHFAAMGGYPSFAIFHDPPASLHDGRQWHFAVQAFERDAQTRFERALAPETPDLLGAFFEARRFPDVPRLVAELTAWVARLNATGAGGLEPAARWAEERACLRPLQFTAETLGLELDATVGPDGRVDVLGETYALPAKLANEPAAIHVYLDQVRMVVADRTFFHPRKFGQLTSDLRRFETGPDLLDVAGSAVVRVAGLMAVAAKRVGPAKLAEWCDEGERALADLTARAAAARGAVSKLARQAGEAAVWSSWDLADFTSRTLVRLRGSAYCAGEGLAIAVPLLGRRAVARLPERERAALGVKAAAVALVRQVGVETPKAACTSLARVPRALAGTADKAETQIEALADAILETGSNAVKSASTLAGRAVRGVLQLVLDLLRRIPD